MKSIYSFAALFYYKNLNSPYGLKALDYLRKERGINLDTIKSFTLGTSYSLYGLSHALEKEFPLDKILESKIVKLDNNSNKLRDHFYGFISIPIFKNGLPISFTGRGLPNKTSIKHKHLNGLKKNLFNEDALSQNSSVIITEAPIDCITLAQSGYNAVSIFGTNSFKDLYIKKFRSIDKIFLLFDNDKPGINGSLEIAWKFYKARYTTEIAELPLPGDVNSIWLNNKKSFQKIIDYSLDSAKTLEDDKFNQFLESKLEAEKSKKKRKAKKEAKDLDIEQIKNSIEISKVISNFLEIEKVGYNNYRAFCPFHNDHKTKSFFVYDETNTYYCYGCAKFGDVIQFIQDINHLPFVEAIEWLKSFNKDME